MIQLETIGTNKEAIINKFWTQTKRLKFTADTLFKVFTTEEGGLVSKEKFCNDCIKQGFTLENHELTILFELICWAGIDPDMPTKQGFT